MNNDKNTKKQIPLRISEALYVELERWADDEFRSVNGQIEYLLTECVKKRRAPKIGEPDGKTDSQVDKEENK